MQLYAQLDILIKVQVHRTLYSRYAGSVPEVHVWVKVAQHVVLQEVVLRQEVVCSLQIAEY